MRKLLVLALTVFLTMAFAATLLSKVQVGEEVRESFTTAHPYPGGGGLVYEKVYHNPNSGYISIHFSNFDLAPGDYVEISSADGNYSYLYNSKGKVVRGGKAIISEFWATHIPGSTAVVRLYSRNPKGGWGFEIDKWVRGYEPEVIDAMLTNIELETKPTETSIPGETLSSPEAICSSDDMEWAKCYDGTTMYDKARAVARLLINGVGACTGWLVGSQGNLMTNNHCIGSASDAANTDYELMAEGATCGTDCTGWFACPGTVVASSATLVRTNAALDYTLVKLPTNPTRTYGFLQMRDRGTAIGERIYIPGYPQAWGKKIAVYSTHPEDTSGMCEVQSLTETPCSGGPGDIGYYCDTQGGSSGSPVISECDNAVIALHHCAYCPNRGVPIQEVIADLGSAVPANAISTAAWDCDDCGPGWCDGVRFCDKWGCYAADSNISRLFCCGYLDPREGLGSCYGASYCTGPNYLGLCYVDTAIQSRVMCNDEDLTVSCKALPADDDATR